MKISNQFQSPNFQAIEIPVEFIILHYTACDLAKTLEIFMDPQKKVTAHWIIDTEGMCYDLGNFLNGKILKGAHAGKSSLTLESQEWDSFNQFSVGIELVNLNGNLFEYTPEQYESLTELILQLRNRFPNLYQANRILGHEHIAHQRGKADPGILFCWNKLLTSLKLKKTPLHQFHICTEKEIQFLKGKIQDSIRTGLIQSPDFWPALSDELEKKLAIPEAV